MYFEPDDQQQDDCENPQVILVWYFKMERPSKEQLILSCNVFLSDYMSYSGNLNLAAALGPLKKASQTSSPDHVTKLKSV